MKKLFLLPLFFFVFAFACKKDSESSRPAILHISGLVTDEQTSAPLDSVEIILKYTSGIASISLPQKTYYGAVDGSFNFQFAPKEDYLYTLRVSRPEYNARSPVHIDLDKEYQEFNVQLEK